MVSTTRGAPGEIPEPLKKAVQEVYPSLSETGIKQAICCSFMLLTALNKDELVTNPPQGFIKLFQK
jgi:hypothetical protein